MSNPLFRVHKLNQTGLTLASVMAEQFEKLHNDLEPVCKGSGREWSIVKTKLEEAAFFAKKAMAMDPNFHE